MRNYTPQNKFCGDPVYRSKSNNMLGVCEQVVGKVVIKLVQVFGLYNLSGNVLAYVVNYVFTVRRLLAHFKQAIVACAQQFQAFWEGLAQNFYTFSTGPTNTNKLNKGLNR